MKHIFSATLMALLGAICLSSCNNNSYSAQLKAEKELIEEYISRNHINIIYEEPEYMEWQENDYLEISDYCYFHLSVPGDTASKAIEYKDNVLMRYRQYKLTVNADTLSYWNTNEMSYPIQFQFNVSSDNACDGWHYALKYMRYSGAEGKLICPTRLGFNSASNTVLTPYGYDLKMKISRF